MLDIVLLAALGGLRLCCLEPVKITSVSMEPAAPRDAIMIVDHRAFRAGRRPAHGDLVVFDSPGREGERLVKRVIGVPGDTVAVRDRALHLNGERVGSVVSCDERTCIGTETLGAHRYRVVYAVESYVSGEGEWSAGDGYIVMGDNRDHSWDSRFFGAIPAAALRGHVVAGFDSVTVGPLVRLLGAVIW